MKIESKTTINYPLDEVYRLVRDDLQKLVPYLPNVDKIDVIESNAADGKVEVLNHWYGRVEIPSMLKKVIKPEIMSWKDKAVWNDSEHNVVYEMESFIGNDLYDANGLNTFTAIDENTTVFTVSCDLIIYPEKVPGIPRLLAGKIKPMVEALISKILGPNLSSLGDGINQYYKDNQ